MFENRQYTWPRQLWIYPLGFPFWAKAPSNQCGLRNFATPEPTAGITAHIVNVPPSDLHESADN